MIVSAYDDNTRILREMSYHASRDAFSMDTDPTLCASYPGLTTKEALNRLYHDVQTFKNEICHSEKKTAAFKRTIKDSFHHSSYNSTFSWIPITVLNVVIIFLLFYTSMSFSLLCVIFLMILNIAIVFWENVNRNYEFEKRINYILQCLKKTSNRNDWNMDHFLNLYTPHSPSVSLHWTIRDGQIINLPIVLLVKGDIIIMRPGQTAPADLETVLPPPSQENKYNVLLTDQLLDCDPVSPTISVPHSETVRSLDQPPLAERLYMVTKSPYISQLKSINNKHLEKPTSLYNKARYLLYGKCVHHVSLPTCLVICELLATVRLYILSDIKCQHYTQNDKWIYFFIIEPASILIPLASLAFPLFWYCSNAIGNALLLSKFSIEDTRAEGSDFKNESDTNKLSSFFYEDLETGVKDFSTSVMFQKNKFFRYLAKSIYNDGFALISSTNFLHTMASVTALCCVDKKGVLSFPNPIAEKVFFVENISINRDLKENEECSSDVYEETKNTEDTAKLIQDKQNENVSKHVSPNIEILDITPRDEKGSAWKIEFDDSHWREHINSLKPIGLAILLNTCNRETHKSYNHFCAYITSHALQNKHLIPVANRRCLCELARQIGFYEELVSKTYDLEIQLFTYKSLTGNKYVQALFKTRKPQFPFPHAMSVIVNNDSRNSKMRSLSGKEDEKKRKKSERVYSDRQMFSQGTADVILDYCVDYWDGNDVHPLTPAVRKKILDFFQRSSLTAYCTAFSYRPVYKNLKYIATSSSNGNDAVYLELLKSLESRKIGRPQKHKTKVEKTQNKDAIRASSSVLDDVAECDEENIDDYNENICSNVEDHNGNSNLSGINISDEEESDETYAYAENGDLLHEEMAPKEIFSKNDTDVNYYHILRKQIFLGMVSMQYQPFVDMVQMIEDIEKACIRFVHFSKENELRSRVFSEKMGLESGWNCHISLLPENECKNQLNDIIMDNSESISTGTDLDISSTIETGASSADDEENVPIAFDVENRAKLPCGIDNIRPHLENVDNVPLLVSLFTDCTTKTTKQMLEIMQEYGQVVCVLGSCANIKNFPLFARANASISVDPLVAQVCQQIPLFSDTENKEKSANYMSPIELSRILNTLPCSLNLQRNYNNQRVLPLCPLIANARNFMRLIWNCCQFWLCCTTLVVTIQILSVLLFLPVIFNLEQALWISVIMIPCLSISLVAAPYDDEIMNKTKGKDWLCTVNWTTIKYAITCYGSKLLGGIVSILIFYIVQLMAICNCLSNRYTSTHITEMNSNHSTIATPTQLSTTSKHCVYVFIKFDVDDEMMEMEYINTLEIIQYHLALTLSLNLTALSLSFLHRETVCWKRFPRVNIFWILFVFGPLSIQIIHFILRLHWYWSLSLDCLISNVSKTSWISLIFTCFSPCLTYLCSEIVKVYEIRTNERYQRRVRLEFGTKLGMNSPF